MSTFENINGDLTHSKLLNYTSDQKQAERLSGHILQLEGFTSIDPSHPLGGPDGLKDVICTKYGVKYIAGVYFPDGQRRRSEIQKKFLGDLKGVEKNNVDGFIFITNQKLTLKQRENLIAHAENKLVDIYHLERLVHILNTPIAYGVRLTFLNISLSREEQIAYFATKDQQVESQIILFEELLQKTNNVLEASERSQGSISKLGELKYLLEQILDSRQTLYLFGNSPIDRLKVPLQDLKQFEELLNKIAGFTYPIFNSHISQLRVPISQIKEFEIILNRIVSSSQGCISPIQQLNNSMSALANYERSLDRIISKLKDVESLKSKIFK